MAGPEIRVIGARELRSALRQLGGKGVLADLRAAHKRVSELVVARALPHVPVLTGRLRSSVRALASQTQARARAGGARVKYAAAIHWGRSSGNVNFTSGRYATARGGAIEGRPFLSDAAHDVLDEAVDIYERDVTTLINRALTDVIDGVR